MSDKPSQVTAVLRDCLYYWYDETEGHESDDVVIWGWPGRDPADVDPENFGIRVEIDIGPHNDPAFYQEFDAVVCSWRWFCSQLSAGRWENPWFWGGADPFPIPAKMLNPRGLWLMDRWSQEDFESALKALCNFVSPAPDWDTLAARLTRQLNWDDEAGYDDQINERHGLPAIWRRPGNSLPDPHS
jgi:hypothetical protein